MLFNSSLRASCLAIVLAASSAAHAASLTQVSNLSNAAFLSFTDAAGSTYTAPVAYALDGNMLSFSGFGNQLERLDVGTDATDSNFPLGTQLIAQCGMAATCSTPSIMSITFARPVNGFMVSVDDASTAPTTIAVAAYDGTTSLGLVTASSTTDSGGSPAIIAATSTAPITSIQITDYATPGVSGDFVVGDIGIPIAVTQVPEPSSLALFGAGFLGLVTLRRKG